MIIYTGFTVCISVLVQVEFGHISSMYDTAAGRRSSSVTRLDEARKRDRLHKVGRLVLLWAFR